jgi:hypothetical protein
MPAGSIALPSATPSTDAPARPNAARERTDSPKSAAGRDRKPDSAPQRGPTQQDGAATAAAGGSVAPPAVYGGIIAALAALAAHRMRRLRARMLVPVAPGVPSLRDRPG